MELGGEREPLEGLPLVLVLLPLAGRRELPPPPPSRLPRRNKVVEPRREDTQWRCGTALGPHNVAKCVTGRSRTSTCFQRSGFSIQSKRAFLL